MRLFGDTFGLFCVCAIALIVAVLTVAVQCRHLWDDPPTGADDRIEYLQEDAMCRYCKGTGRYRLLDKVVDCDQCDAVNNEHDIVDWRIFENDPAGGLRVRERDPDEVPF